MDSEQLKSLQRKWDEYTEMGMPEVQSRIRTALARVPKPISDSTEYLENITYDDFPKPNGISDEIPKVIQGMRSTLSKASSSIQQQLIRSELSATSSYSSSSFPDPELISTLTRYDKQLILNEEILQHANKVRHREEATLLWSLWKYQPFI